MFSFAVLGVLRSQDSLQREPRATGEEILIPQGNESLPAEQVFHNIEILKGKPAARLPGMMKGLNRLLGVQCTHCHVAGAWDKEELAPKRTAREMFKMLGNISEKYFDDENKVSCWTCHGGNPKPSNGATEISAGLAKLPKERQQLIDSINPGPDKVMPAGQAFQNIQVFNDTPGARIAPIMAAFTVALNVGCAHCHVADQYDDDDKPAKQRTGEMVHMVENINRQFFHDQPKVGCWTCHRGAVKPEIIPPSTN
jgi:hypothetical protein